MISSITYSPCLGIDIVKLTILTIKIKNPFLQFDQVIILIYKNFTLKIPIKYPIFTIGLLHITLFQFAFLSQRCKKFPSCLAWIV